MEFEITTILFLAIVVVGTVVQTITGFALGLIIVAFVTLLSLADIAFTAAVVSMISLVNALVALRKGHREVDWNFVRWILAGLIPAMGLGFVILTLLSEHNAVLLKMLLGLVIVLAGMMLMISPQAFPRRSPPWALTIYGGIGGVFAGMYSAAGAPIAYFLYRQPVSINRIRFSLLAIFAVTTAVRTLMVIASGHMTEEIALMAALSVPLVVVTTLLTTRLLAYIPDKLVRRVVFVVLIFSGLFLVVSSFGAVL